jgi:transposase
MTPRHPSPTALRDKDWDVSTPLGPDATPGGRPAAYPQRELLNAIFSLVRRGGSGRMLPHDLPPGRSVSHDVRPWRVAGPWALRHARLRGAVRVAAGHQRQPSAGSIESPAVKTTDTGGAGATRRARRSKGARVISAASRAVGFAASSSPRPVGKTPTALGRCWRGGGLTALAYGCSGPTRPLAATWALGCGDDAPGGQSAWRVSNARRGSRAACAVPNGGSWSGPSPGSAATAASRKMMSP